MTRVCDFFQRLDYSQSGRFKLQLKFEVEIRDCKLATLHKTCSPLINQHILILKG